MSNAREIIADAYSDMELNAISADDAVSAIIARLTAAGFRILAPDELDPVTVERCAQVVEHDDRHAPARDSRYAPDWLHHARRKAAELRTLTGGNNGR